MFANIPLFKKENGGPNFEELYMYGMVNFCPSH